MPTLLEEGLLLSDRYRIHELIGSGGSGWVYRATQEPIGRQVAVKVLRTDLPGDDQIHFEARFLREASLTGQLQHPHIVTIHDYGRSEHGYCYLVMEYLEGYTLREVLRRHQVPVKRIMRIFDGLCQGLRHAHARGMVHRDVKPSNVFLVRGEGEEWRPKLMDFGLVREVHSEATITEVGTFLGTPQYIAPEQATGEPADARSDVYSIGVMLYRALCGKLPYVAPNPAALAYMHVHQPYPYMAERAPGVEIPSKLEAICQRCMKKDPSERYADAGELLEDLRVVARFVLGPDVLPPPDKSASRVAAVALKEPELPISPEDDLEPRIDTEETDVGGQPTVTDAMDTPAPLPVKGAGLGFARETLVPPDEPVTTAAAPPPRRRMLFPILAVLALVMVLSCGGLAVGLQVLLGARLESLSQLTELFGSQPAAPVEPAPAVVSLPPEPAEPEALVQVDLPVEPAPAPEAADRSAEAEPVVPPPPVLAHPPGSEGAREREQALEQVREALSEPAPDPQLALAMVDPEPTPEPEAAPSGGLGLAVTNSLGQPVPTETVVASAAPLEPVQAADPEPVGLVIKPADGAQVSAAPAQRGSLTVDDVSFTPDEARRTLAWINTATERELKNAGVYSLGVTNILQQRPYDSIEVFAATHYVGTASVQAAKYAAIR